MSRPRPALWRGGPGLRRSDARYGQALVIGASMAGLVAARALADHFDHVVLVERDRLPEAPAFRPGVPQARHVHTLLARGQQILERLFPGLTAELGAAGAERMEWPADFLWLSPAGWAGRPRSALVTAACSRELLEWTVRQRVARLPNVRFVEECVATGLVSDQRSGVAGILVRPRKSQEAGVPMLADLVVDASGRGSHAPRWLAALGYPTPVDQRVDALVGYATRIYARPPSFDHDWKIMGIQSRPPRSARAGVIYSIEQDRWVVTLSGAAGDYPPTDEPGFLAFARSLPTPLLYEAIRNAEPLSDIVGYRGMENRIRHFERLRIWPENFVVLGDALCIFNPIYGQGMSVSAEGALVLDQELRGQRARFPDGQLTGLAVRVQRGLARTTTTPWLLATGEDFRYPATQGDVPNPFIRVIHAYLDRVILAATRDPDVHVRLQEVLHLLRPPIALFAPSVLTRALAAPVEGSARHAAQPRRHPTPR